MRIQDRLGHAYGHVHEVRRQGCRTRVRGEFGAEPGEGQRHATPDEPALQQIAGAGESAADGSDRPAQFLGRLLLISPLQVAEDDRQAIFLGEGLDRLVQDRQRVRRVVVAGGFAGHVGRLAFVNRPPPGRPLDPERSAIGDAMQPRRQRPAQVQRLGLACQDDQGRLKGVLGRVRVGKDLATRVPDQCAMPLQQRDEGRLVLVAGEAAQQGRIIHDIGLRHADQRSDVVQHTG